jgi:hypothetical protein
MSSCKHSAIGLGATLISSIDYSADKTRRMMKNIELVNDKVEPTPKCKHSDVASEATPNGSAGHAPDEN